MPKREDILREKTHKGQFDDLGPRIHATLTDNGELGIHRPAKAIALLISHLHSKGLISDSEIDDLLFDCVQ